MDKIMDRNTYKRQPPLLSTTHAMQNGFDLLKRWWAMQALKVSIAEERRKLATLELRELKDMGIHPSDAQHEYQRSFDDIPTARIPKRLR